MSIPSLSISCLEIPVSDPSRATEWYGRVLGYVPSWANQDHAMLARPGDPRALPLLLVRTGDDIRLHFRSSANGVVHSVLDFETDDLEATHAWIAAHVSGLPPIPEPANDWAPRGFGFADSEGNRLAVFSYKKVKSDKAR